MNDQRELIEQLKIQMLRFIGFKKKGFSQSTQEEVLFFDMFAKDKNYCMYRYSVELPKNTAKHLMPFSTMGTPDEYIQSIRKNSFAMENCFFTIRDMYLGTELTRVINDTTEIHMVVVKQYWFDCCVSFQIFLNMLMAPIQHKEWINSDDFLKSMEAVHQKNVFRGFFSEKQDKKLSSMMRYQKILCKLYLVFFCVVEFEYKEIDLNCLITIIELSHRMQKTKEKDLINLAKNFLERANKKRKEIRACITFKEFKDLIYNSSL